MKICRSSWFWFILRVDIPKNIMLGSRKAGSFWAKLARPAE